MFALRLPIWSYHFAVVFLLSLLGLGHSDVSFRAFYPGHTNTQQLQEDLRNILEIDDVIVYGRARDFHNDLRKLDPVQNKLIVMLPGVLQERIQNNYTVRLYQSINQTTSEKYLLVSTQKVNTLTGESDCRFALIDMLGDNREMRSFVENNFTLSICATERISYRRVNKLDDLLLTLLMDLSNVIIVSESDFPYLQSQTDQPLHVLSKSESNIPMMIIASPTGNTNANITQYIQRLQGAKLPISGQWIPKSTK
jgi:hypothetical protein